MQWNAAAEQVLCFTNNIPRDGGTHPTVRAAMTRVITKYIDDSELAKSQRRGHR
jgi:DNA gyrase subunit B